MKRLDLKNYMFSVKNQQGINQLMTYDFKDILINILTHTSLGLNAPELLEINEVVEKIEKADKEVILADEEYQKIINICKRFRGFSKHDIQLVKRIYNCPDIPDNGK